jgi:serine/threonine protein kinase
LMIWPPRISNLLQDVINKCLEVKPESRPSAAKLLEMPFFQKYKDVDRRKLHEFLMKLRSSASEYESSKARKAVEGAIQRSMNVRATDYHEVRNRNTWSKWNSGLGGIPPAFDNENFPALV